MAHTDNEIVLTNIDDVLGRIISERMVLSAPYSRSDRYCELVLPLEDDVQGLVDVRVFAALKCAIDQNVIDPDEECEAITLRYVMIQEPGCVKHWGIVDGSNLDALEWEVKPH